ncbi:tryptophan--tRNA ligase [Candidatus Woesebacteria bacterium RIFCSPHIGHO2_02_FULL_38_9]|uniref:Tryptophan--tRNA ligase n=1 Tax=Candidatus Woesebacteria bacterium RIFCSPHIGHO2_01_FULL_39_28 TaxID=1802496 RepID=A0A1F7YI91_9BACT|nr:MAG: tryptophan--tRNA ligase [Candidatus Woesebacteria bacterium RIFCSPHIGHO2_01_FULL_39_28]OGM34254.1 MAG: tryptophan--tRNA ligase [Candidatus Woesebacteria bacterium RIFCSPHIGHO2_02_FULL_38_9]OGM57022.1 MAG: tryptophan--tRNA ligase [Candidatus Woesebacteria bacterium RIFCSPLOWO2_01_FULL_38_20]
MEKRRVVFSGIQPSGNLHIGNYIGAIRQWVALQSSGLNVFCIVDLHAITVPQDPKELREKTLELAALLLASGIDPEKSLLFIQSHNPDHVNLGWILNCFLSMGQLSRMTQYKEKSESKDFVSVGLFDYPALMAADILLYDTTEVPVGEDQKQHVEITRDAAERFNSRYGETFILPKPVILKVGSRIASLADPTKKMSKSDTNPNSTIYVLDKPEDAERKIMSAVTDSGDKIVYDPARPGIFNLIEIYTQLTGKSVEETEKEFDGKGYKEFKENVAGIVLEFLKPFQEKYKNFRESKNLLEILENGVSKAYGISHKKLLGVYDKVGFVKKGN